jgi:hypothetical protein
MKILGLALVLLMCVAYGRAQTPAMSPSPFYSADEYQRAHSIFDKLSADLNAAQVSASANLISQARAVVNSLENNWDRGVYDSRQMDDSIAVLQRLAGQSPLLRDRNNIGADVSRLLDLRQQYY